MSLVVFLRENACNATEEMSTRTWDLKEMLTFSQRCETKKVRLTDDFALFNSFESC